jgi:hypothetical protein
VAEESSPCARIGRVWNREDSAGSLIAGPRGMLKMRGERKKIGHAFDAARRIVSPFIPAFASDEMTSSSAG